MQLQFIDLPKPSFHEAPPREFAGLSVRYSQDTRGGIAAQWQRFTPWIERLPSRGRSVAWGVVFNSSEHGEFDYLCGVEVAKAAPIPAGLVTIELEGQDYAVFAYPGHLSQLPNVMHTLWKQWLPASSHQLAPAALLERYGPEFDPQTGNGGFEVWLPLA